MSQWLTIYKKEMLRTWRNKQIIWLPLVMMLIGIIDVITYYYLPEVIELSGGLPDGAVFDVPAIKGHEAILMGLDQLSLMGALVIIAISMGTIANERNSGLAEIMLTKPIHHSNYVTAKWFALITITVFSLCLAIGLNWYYTNILFDTISIKALLQTCLFYSLWFIFIVTIALFFNSFLSKSGLVFAFTTLTLFLLAVINTAFGHRLPYFPNQLTSHIDSMLITGDITKQLLITSSLIGFLILCLLTAASFIFKHHKL